MKLLARAHFALESHHIPHALIGAAALAVHGVSRATLDLDLLACARRCLDPTTWRDLSATGVAVDIRRGDADDPLAGVVRLEAPKERLVDVVVGRSRWQAGIISRARPAIIDDVAVPVALAADLVLLKLYAGGPQDRWDIQQLLASEESDTIVTAVDRDVAKLPARCRSAWRDLRPC